MIKWWQGVYCSRAGFSCRSNVFFFLFFFFGGGGCVFVCSFCVFFFLFCVCVCVCVFVVVVVVFFLHTFACSNFTAVL